MVEVTVSLVLLTLYLTPESDSRSASNHYNQLPSLLDSMLDLFSRDSQYDFVVMINYTMISCSVYIVDIGSKTEQLKVAQLSKVLPYHFKI